jgi:hypothetical protein
MDISVFYNLPALFATIWNWCGNQDPRVAFAFGVGFYFVVERILSLSDSPARKVIAFTGFILVAIMALAFWVAFAGVLEPGEIPFGKAATTPNADTLLEIQKQ